MCVGGGGGGGGLWVLLSTADPNNYGAFDISSSIGFFNILGTRD